MKRVFLYLKECFWQMCGGLAMKMTASVAELFIPWILAHIVDDIIPTKNTTAVLLWGGGMVLCSLMAVVFNVWANRVSAAVSGDATERMRHDLFTKIIKLSSADIDRFTIPSLISRMTSDTYETHRVLGVLQRMGVRAPMIMLGGIVITLTLDPVLSLVMISAMPILAAITVFISRKGVKLYKTARRTGDDMIRVARENITGVRVIKALSKGEHEKLRFEEKNRKLTTAERVAGRTMAGVNPIMSIILNLSLVAVIIVGAYRVNAGLTEPGKIIAFMSYITMIFNALLAVTRLFTMFSRASASAGRIFEVMDCECEPMLDSAAEIRTEPLSADAPAVCFENVSFKYPDSGFLLQDISFSIGKGETLGILGATGSGKSTLLRLLLRFYSPDSGRISVGGTDITTLSAKELRRHFGVVFQNDILFAGTVADNLNFDRSISMEDIEKAIKNSCADEFIDDPATEVAIKGANFSGGQKQRLMIARALAGSPDILILDDSSSALDYLTDAQLRENLATITDSTKIIIAQRVSSIMHSRRILVIDDGRIIGCGSHAELMESCAVYRETYEVQMGGAEND